MDREAWKGGVTRVGHDLATKPAPPHQDSAHPLSGINVANFSTQNP